MKHRCFACGRQTDAVTDGPAPDEVHQIHRWSEGVLRIQMPSGPWRAAVACWPCFWKTEPDMWIRAEHWDALNPLVPSEKLPPLAGDSVDDYPWPLDKIINDLSEERDQLKVKLAQAEVQMIGLQRWMRDMLHVEQRDLVIQLDKERSGAAVMRQTIATYFPMHDPTCAAHTARPGAPGECKCIWADCNAKFAHALSLEAGVPLLDEVNGLQRAQIQLTKENQAAERGRLQLRQEITALRNRRDDLEKQLRIETERSRALESDLAILRSEQEECWAVLGGTAEEAAQDPDTARLPDAIRVDLEHEENSLQLMREELQKFEATVAAMRVVLEGNIHHQCKDLPSNEKCPWDGGRDIACNEARKVLALGETGAGQQLLDELVRLRRDRELVREEFKLDLDLRKFVSSPEHVRTARNLLPSIFGGVNEKASRLAGAPISSSSDAQTGKPLLCERTGNPCGTDDVPEGEMCPCEPCQTWRALTRA